MLLLVNSETTAATLGANLGLSEYSYYFVLKEFRPALERLGIVVPISDPARDADRIWANAAARGEPCTLLSFAPPHYTPLGLRCPTIPVFAWEFDTIPDEPWGGNPQQDWRYGLGQLGRAITHSDFAVQATRRAMGPAFPIVSIPAPVWDRFAPLAGARGREFAASGRIVDTRTTDLAPYSPRLRRTHGYAPLPPATTARVQLDGVVYASVFNPNDGRKNWFDMVGGFCWAFRDTPDATLLLKLTFHDASAALSGLLEELAKHAPFACRVLLVDAFLDDPAYEALVAATDYVVNTSRGEGQCLPLMEMMSAGRPAISPRNTAMADYVNPANAFVVHSHLEPSHWPHDPRQAYRTLRHRLDFGSLLAAYRESHRVARHEPARYAAMAEAARQTLQRHCSEALVVERLRDVLDATAPVAA